MPRQLTIFFPDGWTGYWFTASVFDVRDTFERHGSAWAITSITSPDGHKARTVDRDGRHATITVRPDDYSRRIDEVRIALRRGIVTIPWSSRDALLERFRNLQSMNDIRDVFRAVGTTEPVCLTDPQKALLLNVIAFWAGRTDGGYDDLPAGINDLRNALHDDLHHAGAVEAEQVPLAAAQTIIAEHDDTPR